MKSKRWGQMMPRANPEITIAGRKIGRDYPTYFIADIAANHDGDLSRAKDLIHLAAEAGADVAKFQHFKAATIVSDVGFNAMDKSRMSHQASWKKSVSEVYSDASVNDDWTPVLKETCDKAGITFFTTPYAFDIVDRIDNYVPAYKIGSGDITWPQYIQYVAKKKKPMILACGAATMEDTHRAVMASLAVNPDTVLLQCNTNYTVNIDNFK
jgi:N-acetylneuraminate synthase